VIESELRVKGQSTVGIVVSREAEAVLGEVLVLASARRRFASMPEQRSICA